MKSLKSIMKYSLYILAFLLLCLLVIPLFFDANSYRERIVTAMSEYTGRHIEIGSVELSLFPWIGFKLDEVSMGNRQGFTEDKFINMQQAQLQLAFLPLLRSEVEVIHFTLLEPRILLQINADGQTNWDDLAKNKDSAQTIVEKPKPKPKGEDEASKLVSINAESISLRGGEVVWDDASKNLHLSLNRVNIQINDVSLVRSIAVEINAFIENDPFSITGKIGPIGKIDEFDVNKLPLQLVFDAQKINLKPLAQAKMLPDNLSKQADAAVAAHLDIRQENNGVRNVLGDFSLLAKPRVDVAIKLNMPDAQHIFTEYLRLHVDNIAILETEGKISLPLEDKELTYSLHVRTEKLKRQQLAIWLPTIKELYAKHPQPWQIVQASMRLEGDTKKIKINEGQLLLDNDILRITGSSALSSPPDLRVHIVGKSLHADAWLPAGDDPYAAKAQPAKDVSATPKAEEQAVEPDLRFLKPWRMQANVQLGTLFLRGLELEKVRLSLSMKKGRILLEPFSFNLAGGSVSERATLNAAQYPARWTESIKIKQVRLGPVLKTLADMDMLDGILDMKTKMRGVGLLPEQSVARLNGTGKFTLYNGAIKGINIAGSLRKFSISSLTKQKEAVSKPTDFAEMSGSFNISNGIANNKDLFMASPIFRLSGAGKVDLPNKTLDYHLKPKLVKTLVGQGGDNSNRGIVVPLHVHGPFTDPKVELEMKKINPADLIKQLKPLQDALKGSQGKKDVRKQAEQAGKKLLQNLIPNF
ncbi:MAG: AsmA family protein [Mariprofundales bacterium]